MKFRVEVQRVVRVVHSVIEEVEVIIEAEDELMAQQFVETHEQELDEFEWDEVDDEIVGADLLEHTISVLGTVAEDHQADNDYLE